MMKKITAFLLLFAFLSSSLHLIANEDTRKPLSVLIIGGGPAGLASAIEAKESGSEVTLVEKRDNRSRIQRLFLNDSSIDFLKKWQVSIPQMQVADLDDGSRMGFVSINHLEQALEARFNELGIQKIHGEFKTHIPRPPLHFF